MIFQSNIQSGSSDGRNWGIMITLGFHALLLLFTLTVVLPEPEAHPLDPVIMVNFGDPEMGGPSLEESGGTGASTPSPGTNQNRSENISQNTGMVETPVSPEGSVPVKSEAKTKNTSSSNSSNVTTPARKPDADALYTKKNRSGKGNGTGNSEGNGTSDGDGRGNIPGNGGDPGGDPDADQYGFLQEKKRPGRIREPKFKTEETDDPNPYKVYVIVTVSCDGIIRKVAPDLNRTRDSKNIKMIERELKGEKYFESRAGCKGNAKWPMEVTITPN